MEPGLCVRGWSRRCNDRVMKHEKLGELSLKRVIQVDTLGVPYVGQWGTGRGVSNPISSMGVLCGYSGLAARLGLQLGIPLACALRRSIVLVYLARL